MTDSTQPEPCDLLVVGLAYLEVFVPAHAPVPPGEELFVEGIQLALGGALNTASVAAALGLRVSLCVPMGQGMADQAVASMAARLGIRLLPLAAVDNPAISLVFSGPHERSFVSSAQMNTLEQVEHLPAARWIHVPGLEEAARLQLPLALARSQGAQISVSASWSPALLEQLGQAALTDTPLWDLLVLNEKEALAAAGSVAGALQHLTHRARSVLVTLAGQGVAGVLHGAPLLLPAAPALVRDSTGAGDAFCAGLLAGLLRGLEPTAATQLAMQVAACVLGQTGGLVTDPALLAAFQPTTNEERA
jgi:sugar/nucleoside kinase (ribokinase family)